MSDPNPSETAATRFGRATPILRVRSLSASIKYYERVLGFRVDWHQLGVMASVSRDQSAIMLCEADQGNPGTWIWIGVNDVDVLFREYTTAGASMRLEPINYPWAYEMQVEDPDGHVLRFGSDPKTDRVFSAWVVVARDR